MSSLEPQAIQVTTQDGFTLNGVFFDSGNDNDVVIIGSAFGVPHHYYHHFARFLANNKLSVVAFDYRGINTSKTGNQEPSQMRMQDWGEQDLEAVIRWTQQEKSPDNLHYVGHSAGGQIVGLAPSSVEFSNIVLSASGVGAWRKWTGAWKWALAFLWYAIFPLVLRMQKGDFLHSKLLGPIPVPKTVARQWLNWARSKEYLFSPEHELDLRSYHESKANIFGLTISDDWYAPKSSLQALLGHFKSSEKHTAFITPESIGHKAIGHFGLFKNKPAIQQHIWQPMLDFIQSEN